MDRRLSGFSGHGISQASILEWVAISSSRGSSQPRDWTCILPLNHWGSLILCNTYLHKNDHLTWFSRRWWSASLRDLIPIPFPENGVKWRMDFWLQNVYRGSRKTVSLIPRRFWKGRLSKVWQLFDCKISQKLSYFASQRMKSWYRAFPKLIWSWNSFSGYLPLLLSFWTTMLHRTKLGTWLNAWSRLHSVSGHEANYQFHPWILTIQFFSSGNDNREWCIVEIVFVLWDINFQMFVMP